MYSHQTSSFFLARWRPSLAITIWEVRGMSSRPSLLVPPNGSERMAATLSPRATTLVVVASSDSDAFSENEEGLLAARAKKGDFSAAA